MEYRNAEFKCYRKALKVSIVAASAGNTGRFRPSARSLSGRVVHRHAGNGTGAASSRAPARIMARMGPEWLAMEAAARLRRGPGPACRSESPRPGPGGPAPWPPGHSSSLRRPETDSDIQSESVRGLPARAGRKPTRISGNRFFYRRGYSVVESGAGCWRLARPTACEPPAGTESTSRATTTDSPSQPPRPTAYHRPAAAGRRLPGPRARGDASSARPGGDGP